MSMALQPDSAAVGREFQMAAQFVLGDKPSVTGTATSNTVLNLAGVEGYQTSSVWTLRVYQ